MYCDSINTKKNELKSYNAQHGYPITDNMTLHVTRL